jgi:hypothetical protein
MVDVVIDDERDEYVGVKQSGRHLVVLKGAHVFGGDDPTQADDGKPGGRAMR